MTRRNFKLYLIALEIKSKWNNNFLYTKIKINKTKKYRVRKPFELATFNFLSTANRKWSNNFRFIDAWRLTALVLVVTSNRHSSSHCHSVKMQSAYSTLILLWLASRSDCYVSSSKVQGTLWSSMILQIAGVFRQWLLKRDVRYLKFQIFCFKKYSFPRLESID